MKLLLFINLVFLMTVSCFTTTSNNQISKGSSCSQTLKCSKAGGTCIRDLRLLTPGSRDFLNYSNYTTPSATNDTRKQPFRKCRVYSVIGKCDIGCTCCLDGGICLSKQLKKCTRKLGHCKPECRINEHEVRQGCVTSHCKCCTRKCNVSECQPLNECRSADGYCVCSRNECLSKILTKACSGHNCRCCLPVMTTLMTPNSSQTSVPKHTIYVTNLTSYYTNSSISSTPVSITTSNNTTLGVTDINSTITDTSLGITGINSTTTHPTNMVTNIVSTTTMVPKITNTSVVLVTNVTHRLTYTNSTTTHTTPGITGSNSTTTHPTNMATNIVSTTTMVPKINNTSVLIVTNVTGTLTNANVTTVSSLGITGSNSTITNGTGMPTNIVSITTKVPVFNNTSAVLLTNITTNIPIFNIPTTNQTQNNVTNIIK